MSVSITPKPGILDIALYQGGESKLPGFVAPLKLSSNENPFGPPPSAVSAMAEAATMAHRYPSTDHKGLRTALSEVNGLDPERIICGVGSDEIITLLCQAYAGPGDEVLYPEHGFGMYRISRAGGGRDAGDRAGKGACRRYRGDP
jgi:histidinol-phosphate aminotransferase